MNSLSRRAFLKTGGALALSGMVSSVGKSLANPRGVTSENLGFEDSSTRFTGDGISLTPGQYTTVLSQLAETPDFEQDYYSTGGIVEELEKKFAGLLGKEQAVFLPTGTLANHIALRRLAGTRRRVILQADSHIYNDSGDCAQKLSGLNLLPAEGPFNPEAIKKLLMQSAAGRVKTEVGAISLESPLRRGFNTTHSLGEVANIAELARNEGIGLHLDGARLFMQAAHHGFSPREYADPFDTVYVSLYKNFNAAGGAILAGSKEMLADFLHERRMFGGSPPHVWPLAAVALVFADDYLQQYRQAKAVCDRLLDQLKNDPRFDFELIPGGSNGLWLKLKDVDPASFVQKLADRNIHLMPPRPQWNGLLLVINPTLNRMDSHKLAAEFKAAAGS